MERAAVDGDRPLGRLELNGALAWTSDEIEPATGYLGLQAEVPGGGQFRFRNIRVTEVGYRSLFNGSDLTNWERSGADLAGSWKIEDGVLVW